MGFAPWLLAAGFLLACAPETLRQPSEASQTPHEALSRRASTRAAPSDKSAVDVSPFASADAAKAADSATAAPKPWPPPRTEIETPWCDRSLKGVDALSPSTCYVVPEKRPSALLIYLHGIVPPKQVSPQLKNLQKVVASASRRAGVVTLLPRGKKGLAPRSTPGWWGWPTARVSYRKYGPLLIEEIESQVRQLQAHLGISFQSRYVAGSSSGAYFTALLALSGEMPASGYGILSGGAGTSTAELASLPKRPVYFGYGKHDSSAASASSLAKVFRAAGWPVLERAHPLPHGAREIYLDEAFAFWFKQSRADGAASKAL